jgi:hypothetical protein
MICLWNLEIPLLDDEYCTEVINNAIGVHPKATCALRSAVGVLISCRWRLMGCKMTVTNIQADFKVNNGKQW